MKIYVIIILIFIIGILAYVASAFLRLKNKNKSTTKINLSEHKKQEIEVQNKNFSHFMSVISFIVGTILETLVLLLTIYSVVTPNNESIIPTDNTTTTSYNDYTDENTKESHEKNDFQETTAEKNITETVDTEELLAVETTISTYENNDNTIITNDCTLVGAFSSSDTEIQYELQPTYSNIYGFTFYTNNVNLAYSVKITDEKGNEQYTYCIDSDDVTKSPELLKNTTYYITLKAEEGYPEFKILIHYPKSDKYN